MSKRDVNIFAAKYWRIPNTMIFAYVAYVITVGVESMEAMKKDISNISNRVSYIEGALNSKNKHSMKLEPDFLNVVKVR